jgi:2',3'-cyclic-nucleotide 2'-phosphodiesterase/3'-nucleotidase
MTTTTFAKGKTVTIRLAETSDVHGAFFPYDFIERRPMRGTMARVSSYVKRQRQQYGENFILLDNGDILQGQPTCYYTNYVKTDEPNIAAEVINYMKFDAETFGNHDVETGHAVYDKWISDVQCPMLGANIIDRKTGKPYVEPYILLERQGVRIAVLGMITPAIPNWLQEKLWSGLHFEEMVACARQWVKILKEQEHADVIIGLFHSGWDNGIVTADYEEDCARKIAEEMADFDVVFFGHDHRPRNVTMANGVLTLDPANNAQKVAEATITLTKRGKHWKVTHKEGQLVDVTTEEIDPDFMAHFQPQIDRINQYVSQKIGTFAATMKARDAFFGSSAFIDLIHRLQLAHTSADVSFNAPLQFNTEVKAGPLLMSDMFKLYRYENHIYVLRMTGDEIRRHLEMSYDLWVNTMQSPDDHIMQLNTYEASDQQRLGFKNLFFNFDSAAGIDYEVDVTKPDGQKVRILQFSDGRPFDPNAWYRVAMNSYRGNGGGELLTRGAGIPLDELPSRIMYESQMDQRHYLTEYIRQHQTIDPQPLGNWRFVPAAWTEPAIARDRKLLFP